jgi:uncharacterized protein (TIGR02117 family)
VTAAKPSAAKSRAPRTLWQRTRRRLLIACGSLVLLYGLFLALGFVPVNLHYLPPKEDFVVIFVRSNEVHTDLVLPVRGPGGVDWRRLFPPQHFGSSAIAAKYVACGWGNRKFYIETPTWSEFRLSTACGALFWPSETVLHVEYLADAAPSNQMREVRVTREQYNRLVQFVRSTVGGLDEHGYARLASKFSYGAADRFYFATGRYHCFNTCNQWTGRGLAQASVPTGLWTPLKPQVLFWLPKHPRS